MHRRAVLTGIALTTGGLAGCLESADADPENGTDPENAEELPEPTLGDSSIETTGTDCASDDADDIDVQPGDGEVIVRGTIGASTPCHDAVLESITLEDRTLELTVDVAKRDGACVECVGEIDYEVTASVENPDGLEEVQVDHVGGSTHGAGWESESGAASAPPADEER